MQATAIRIDYGGSSRLLKLGLDETLSNEATILAFLRNGRLYEPDVSTVMLRTLEPGDLVVDVGANIGYFTCLAASLVGPSGRVLAFEPDPANIARLESNLALNGLANVTIVPQPASDRPGEVTFFLNSDSSGGNALWDPARFPGNRQSAQERKPQTLQATTLDAEIARLGGRLPKLVKIDTEGAEQKVLEGAPRLLGNAAVPFVVAELHLFGLAQLGASQESLRGLMAAQGYETFLPYFDDALPKLIPRGTALRPKAIVNLLFATIEGVGRRWPDEIADPLKSR